MYRVILAPLAMLAVAGCSLGTKSLSLNLNEPPATKIDPNFVSGGSRLGDYAGVAPSGGGAVAGSIESSNRTAMLSPPATKPSVSKPNATKPPTSAGPSRNFKNTALNIAQARAMINSYRRKNGLGHLSLDAQLTKAAHAHSRDLAKWDRISHYGSDGSNPWDRVRRTGYKARLAAENVGTGQSTLKEVFAGWMKSPGHNKNLLLKDAKHMGIALVYDAKTEFKTFWTLVIGSKS